MAHWLRLDRTGGKVFNRDGARGLIVGLLLGTVLGFFLANLSSRGLSAPAPLIAPVAQAPADPALESQARIFAAEQEVLKDPKNTNAWIALGNDYFDAHKPQQAVEAYSKALALNPDNADVLTDQGVMYRELKAFDKAITNWEKAQRINPKHVQSLYNMGVVYANDLGKPDQARKAWTKVIELAPGTPQATQAQDGLKQLGAK
jgi:tetratricopeptide (TPR) repeat protein